ncbi:alkyl hydroperoxide reductase [Sediminicola sp. YIK13]|uniref:peroxiredoxin n=1 Tax=Sediminicola sp. YIK13 TaxID=1453352 RepID=UPI00071FDC7C|nr:peroxiredoxin [Sediminicola sp. YIK13]ALM06553.1 alkyl hydroperoxide reductase [Sediminicola sp. YIK13]
MALQIGDRVPEFSLKDQHGNMFTSNSIVGSKAMVIFFYPKDDTPGCTKEACSFRDSYEEFKELGAEVIGISSDSEKSHQKFASKYELPFILLSDEKKKVRKSFKVDNNLFNLLPGRETYVIDKKGNVIMVFNSISASKHMKKALEALKSAVAK